MRRSTVDLRSWRRVASLAGNVFRYTDRSIRSELCSWSSSFTNFSFYKRRIKGVSREAFCFILEYNSQHTEQSFPLFCERDMHQRMEKFSRFASVKQSEQIKRVNRRVSLEPKKQTQQGSLSATQKQEHIQTIRTVFSRKYTKRPTTTHFLN